MQKENLTIENFVSMYDDLKKRGALITNYYEDINYIRNLTLTNNCTLIQGEGSFFLLVPEFDFFELYYYSLSNDSLFNDLEDLLRLSEINSLKIKIVSRNQEIEKTNDILFEKLGFSIAGRLLRLEKAPSSKLNKKKLDAIEQILSDLPDSISSPRFAKIDDLDNVYDLLSREFDPVVDSLPEKNDVLAGINRNQVVVVYEGNKLIGCHYFELKVGKYFGLFDVVDADYRAYGILFLIYKFVDKYLSTPELNIKKRYGWRNFKRSTLINASKFNNDNFDGTVISIYFYKKG